MCQRQWTQIIQFNYTNPSNNPTEYSIIWNANSLIYFTDTSNAALNGSSVSISIPAGIPAGTYSGNIFVFSNDTCVSQPYPFSIIINPTPLLGNDLTGSFCTGGSLNLNSLVNTSGLTAIWTINGNTVSNPSAVNQAGTYQLVATNSAGCADTLLVQVSSTNAPSASISYPSSVCSNTTPTAFVNLTGSLGGTYSSTSGLAIDPVTGSINTTQSTPGTYTVTYTVPAQGACPATTATASITINAPPVISLQPTDTGFCKFNTLMLYSNGQSSSPYTVQWQVSTDFGASYSEINGATSAIYNGGIANTNQDFWYYRVRYSNACGTTTSRVAVINVSSPLNPQDNPASQTACDGIGTVTFFASGNGGNGLLGSVWQYSPDGGTTWIDIPSTANTTNIGNISNTYTFTANASQNGYLFRLRFDNGRCASSVSASATLTVNPTPEVNQPASPVVCAGGPVAPIVFTGTGTSYQWTNNNSSIGLGAGGTGNIPLFTAVNNGSSPQVATITVTPIFTGGNPVVSCPGPSKTFTITVNPAAIVSAGPAFTICYGNSITLSGSIGGGATSATWSAPSGTFSNVNALNASYTPSITSGSVTLTLTSNDPDGAGPCLAVISTTTITVSLAATVNPGPDRGVCAGGSITLAGSIGGSATSATWTASSGTFSSPTSLNSTYTPSITSGNVVLILTTNDPPGACPPAQAYMVLTVYPKPTANAGSAQTICSGVPVNLSGTIGGGATGGVWSAPSGTFGDPNSPGTTYTPTITSGSVVLTLTANTPAGTCPPATSNVTITVLANPVVSINSTNVACFGGTNGSATASASGSGLSYSWNTNPVRTTSTISNLTAGTYIVTVTDNKGCRGTASVTITQPPQLIASANSTPVSCNGGTNGTASVTVSGGTPVYSYSWNTNPVRITSAVTGLGAGTYTVTVTDSKGCTTSATVSVTQPAALGISQLPVNVLCNGASTGSVTISATGGTTPYQGTGTFNNLAAGTYTYIVTDANGCTRSISAVITQPSALNVTFIKSNVTCNGGRNGSVTISATGGTAPYQGVGTISGLGAGNYNYTVTDANGCTRSVAVTITEPPAIIVTKTETNVSCFGGTNGSVIIGASGGASPYFGTGTFTGLAAGTYTYTVRDASNCTASVQVTITQPPALDVSVSPTPVLCNGGNSGSATVLVTGGTPGYSYNWNTSPAQTGVSATNLGAGTYSVTVTDTRGCTRSASVVITQPPVLTISETHTNVLCNGASTGTASISASGGTGPYSGTGTFIGLTAGSYNYTITDANGCTKSIAVIITQPPAIVVSETHINVSCNGGNNGSITISATGGTAPLGGTGTFNNISAGTYNYTVTDAAGCTAVIPVTVTEPPVLNVTASPTQVLCNGAATGSVIISASGGTPTYTGAGTFSNLASGNYFYTVTDSKGCSRTVPVSITQPSALNVTATPVHILCNGSNTGSVTVSATGGTAPYTGAGTFNNLTAGTYNYMVTDANGCSVNVSATVTQPPALAINGTVSNPTCFGNTNGSIIISASGGTAPYTGTGNFSGLAAGNYSYTVTDANGCTASFNTTLSSPNPLTLSASTTNAPCNGGTGTATVNASGGTAPYTGAGLITGLIAGSHTLTVTDANGCSQTVNVTITQPPPIIVSETHTNVLCNGGATGTAVISATGGTGTLSGTGTFSGLAVGPHIFTVTDQNGCQGSVTVNITQATNLQAIASVTNVTCYNGNNGAVVITATGGTGPYTGQGSFPNLTAGAYTFFVTDANNCTAFINVTINQPSPVIVTLNPVSPTCNGGTNGSMIITASGGTGTYTGTGTISNLSAGSYTYTVTDASGCTGSATAVITAPATLTASANTTPVNCLGGNNGTVTITANGGTAPYTGTGLFTGLAAGNYSYIVSDANGCSTSVNFTISQPPVLTASAAVTNVRCNNASNGTVFITASGGTAPYSGTGLFSGLATGTYSYNVTDANGCSVSVNFSVTEPPLLVASASVTNVSCAGGTNGTATITATGGTAPYTGTETFTGLAAGNYSYIISDSKGCSAIINVNITSPDPLILAESHTDVSCFGGSDGIATITATGGTGPYTGAGTFSGLTAGSRTFTVTDAAGCQQSITINISQPPVLSGSTSVTPATYNGTANGSVTITASGGTAPYTGTGTISGLAAGTYTYVITDSKNCTASVNVTVGQPSPLTANATITNVSCHGNTNGSVLITASGGTAPYTGDGNISGLSAGSYSYTITDAKGCSTTIPVIVNQPPVLTAAASVTNPTCAGGNNGSVTITASGGTGPYTGTGTFSGLSAGTNNYTVTDANGCTYMVTAVLSEPSPLILSATTTQILCNGGSSGTATIIATGGTGPYAGDSTYNNLSLGQHTFTVTDAAGCSKSITVNITQATTLTATAVKTDVTCFGGNNGTVIISASGGTLPHSGIGFISGLSAGNYSYTVSDANGCQAVVNVTINQPAQVTPSATPVSVLCNGQNNGSVIITATGGTSPYTGTGNFSGLAAGSYTYTVTDIRGCTGQVPVTITEPAILQVSPAKTDISCYGGNNGSIQINAVGGTGPYTGTGTFGSLAAGNYSYTITDANGCTASATINITEPAPLVLSQTNTKVSCSGGSNGTATINATGGTTPYTGTGTFGNLTVGPHVFQVTDAAGCQQSITVNITQEIILTASAIPTQVTCNGGNNGSVIITGTGGTAPYTGTGIFSGLTAGSYNYTIADASGCEATVQVVITEPDLLEVNATTTDILCYGGGNGSVQIDATGGTAPYNGTGSFTGLNQGSFTYVVYDANGCSASVIATINEPDPIVINSISTDVTCNGENTGVVEISASGGVLPLIGTGIFNNLTAGTYSYTVTDANGCTASAVKTIFEPSPLVLSSNTTQIQCNGGADGTASITATGGTPPYTGTGVYNNLGFGLHIFTVTDAAGCSKDITVNITQATTLNAAISASTDVTCHGGDNGSVTIIASGGTAPYTGTGTFTGLNAGTYSYTVTDAAGCQALTPVVINDPQPIIISVNKTDLSCNGSNDGTVTISASGGTGALAGTGTFTGLTVNTYNYTVTDANGCSATATAVITQPAMLSATASTTPSSCNGASNGSVTVTATGGTAPYSGTGTFTGLATNTYSYTVTDANGCSFIVSANVTEPSALVLSATTTPIQCNGGADGTATIGASGGTGPYTGTGTFSNLALGPHTFTVTDAAGCSRDTIVNIIQATSLTVDAVTEDVSCHGGSNGSVIITANGGTSPYTGTGTYTGLNAGTYNYTVTDAAGCQALKTVTINQNLPVDIIINQTNILCNSGFDGSVIVSATGGTPPYTGTGTFTGLPAGTYDYTVCDAKGCTATEIIVLTQPVSLSASASITPASCNGASNGSITVTAIGGTAPYSGAGTFTGLAAGSYTYTVTDANGCSFTLSAVVNEPPAIVLSATTTQVPCNGGATGSATITASGGTGPYTGTGTFNNLAFGPHTFNVTDAAGCQKNITVNITQATTLTATSVPVNVTCYGGQSGSVTINATGGTAPYSGTGSFSNLAAGNYSYTVTDATGCQSLTTITINEPQAITVSLNTTNVLCNGSNDGTVTISASGGTGAITGTGTFTGLSANTYNYTVTDANGCSATATAVITQPAALSATASATPASCNGASNGSVTITATGGTAPYSGAGTFTGLAAGSYTYTVTDVNGCSFTLSAVVGEPSAIVLSATTTQIPCNGGATGSATITASGGTGPYTGTVTFNNLAFGPHIFTVTDATGCQKNITVNITQATTLNATSVPVNVTCHGGQNGSVTVNATGGTAPYSGTGTFSNLSAGNYNYTVTDATGCQSLTTITINEPQAITVLLNTTNVLCNGSNDGTVTISASGGTGTITGTGTFTGLSANTYNYTVTDANGCSATATAVITQPAILSATASATPASCNGASNGSVTVTATGGTSPYSGEGTFTGLAAGSYTYTITDANGCSFTLSAMVGEPSAIVLSATTTQIPCNGGATGSATITASGGTGPYTGTGTFNNLAFGPHIFTVTDATGCQKNITVNITQATTLNATAVPVNVTCHGGQNGSVTVNATGGTAPYSGTGTFSNLSAGNYNYTVTDATGCQSLTTITINEPQAITVSLNTTNVLCNGSNDGTVTISASGGTGAITGTGTFTGLSANTYNYTVSDANGCSATATAVITQPAVLSATASATPASCNGASNGSVTVTATGGTAPYSGAGTFTGLAAGSYTYTVTDANGCSFTLSAIVGEPSAIVISATTTQIPCNGGATGSATIAASGGTGPYTGTGTFNNLAFGPHTFTITDAAGCQKNITVNITNITTLQAVANATPVSCAGRTDGSVIISAAGGTGPYAGTGTFTGLAAGNYSYTVTDAAGCQALTSVTINEPAAVSASLNKTDVTCHGSANGTVTVSASGGNGSYSGTGTFTGLTSGTYSYTVTDGNGCSASASISIIEPSPLTITETHTDASCSNPTSGSVTITASGGVAPYTGIGTFNGLPAGNYVYTVSDANSCSRNINVTIINPGQPNLLITNPASNCSGQPVDLTQPSVTAGSDAGLTLSYWTDAGATNAMSQPSNITVSGTYYIKAEGANGCFVIKPVQVSVRPAPTASLSGGGNICEGNSTDLTVTLTGNAPFSITYTDGNSNYNVTGINSTSYTIAVSPATATTYTLISVNDAFCPGTTGNTTVTVTVTQNVAGVRLPTVTSNENVPVLLTARNLVGNYIYDWNPRVGLNSFTSMTPTFTFDRPVEYLITMRNGSGCDVVDTLLVQVENRNDAPKSGIWVPKAWSPNGSGKNDKLRPLCVNIVELKFFRVFNRWGQLMFESNRIGHGWDGIFKGKPQVNDVYTWTLEAYGVDGKRYFLSGNSVLLR